MRFRVGFRVRSWGGFWVVVELLVVVVVFSCLDVAAQSDKSQQNSLPDRGFHGEINGGETWSYSGLQQGHNAMLEIGFDVNRMREFAQDVKARMRDNSSPPPHVFPLVSLWTVKA